MLRQGSAGTYLLALTEGLAKVVCREPGGTVTWLAFRGPGDLLGEVSVFNGTHARRKWSRLPPARLSYWRQSGSAVSSISVGSSWT
ncbi:cyclic nucleotide-binding domain-containing protein [Streptomyces lydicus]|uniref:cyclic nucleotide-binding domain-containing protein n=1 Tax=Streptomyces lydicus TaxID=47763 RepID=UPI00378866A6